MSEIRVMQPKAGEAREIFCASNVRLSFDFSSSVTALLILAGLMGIGAANMDSLLLRSGKVAVGSLPLVGSIVSDSLGAAAACLGLVKGALGRTGMLLVAVQVIGPAGTLLLHGFGFKATASLLGPLEQREMGSLLSALGDMLTVFGALILAAGAMLCTAMAGAVGLLGGGI